jgi:hypothetical protein
VKLPVLLFCIISGASDEASVTADLADDVDVDGDGVDKEITVSGTFVVALDDV